MKDWEIIYQSPDITIGKHRWRLQVYAHPSYASCVRYQWWDDFGFGEGRWMDDERWPRWDTNDTYNGLPKSLSRLYQKYERELTEALIAGHEDWLARHDRATDEWGWDFEKKDLDEIRERWARRQRELAA